MNPAIDSQKQGNGMLGNRVRRVADDADHFHVKACRGAQIDVIESGAAQRNEVRSPLLECIEHRGICGVIHEDTDGAVAGGEANCFQIQGGIEVTELMPFGNIGGVKIFTVVGLGAEYGYFHRLSPSMMAVPGPLAMRRPRPGRSVQTGSSQSSSKEKSLHSQGPAAPWARRDWQMPESPGSLWPRI
ncbi:hypothetical protein D3C81_995690 [compost metagenome]